MRKSIPQMIISLYTLNLYNQLDIGLIVNIVVFTVD